MDPLIIAIQRQFYGVPNKSRKKQLKNYQMNKFQQDGLNVRYISIKIKQLSYLTVQKLGNETGLKGCTGTISKSNRYYITRSNLDIYF